MSLLPSHSHGNDDLVLIRDRVASDLRENVLPFWTRNTWDEVHGGFITHLDREGNRSGVTDKYLVMQARMIWVLAAAHRHGIADRGYLALAGAGMEWFVEHMWDARHGGFWWSVRADGRPLSKRKWIYGQAFAIYALSEYALASGDAQALAWAERVFDLLQEKAGDGELGYVERFGRRWRPEWRPHLHRPRRAKTLDSHMHLMEAVTALWQASGKDRHRSSLQALMELLIQRAIHPEHGCGMDNFFDRSWRRQFIHPERRIATSYGHNAELAWLLLEASKALGEPSNARLEVATRLVDHMLAYGFDPERGGVAMYGPHTGPVTAAQHLPERRLVKNWWEQAETLVALVELYRHTGSASYRAALRRQFEWIWSYQIDHEGGDWHRVLNWDGSAVLPGAKGDEWKCAYHNARALMRVERALSGF